MALKAALKPWEKIAWSPEHEQVLYRDWGLFYTHKLQLDTAAHYYNKSLDLKEDDYKTLLYRSMCKRRRAQTEEALVDARDAARLEENSAPINLEICDALYELNQFENCKVELHDNTRRFGGRKVADFLNRLIVVDENFKDSVGETLSPFILKNEGIFPAVLEKLERENHFDPRPLWKILREQGKCDVLSVLEKEEELLSPREVARRERAFKVFNQIYFNKTWTDVLFLKDLREDPKLLLPQCKMSTPIAHYLTNNKYAIVKKFSKMLQARSPLYNELMVKCPDKKVWERHHEAHLNHIQYQTRRNMLAILRTIKNLRTMGQIEKLSKYIEEVMGDYVVLKTHRVMPWKFEFINEVYNTLALAYADLYTIPSKFKSDLGPERILQLLRVPTDKGKDRPMQFVFGDRSTYQEPDAVDYSHIAYKKYLARLEKRLYFAKYPIERCYLLHEIARSHLKQSRFDECCSMARKAIEEAKHCNSYLWRFLSIILICKSHAVLHKVERSKEAFDEALLVAERLKAPQLVVFIEMCRSLNEAEITMKKKVQSVASMRKARSKQSISSRASQASSHPSAGENSL